MIGVLVRAHLAWLVSDRDVLTAVLMAALAVALAGALALHDASQRALAASALTWLVISLSALVATGRALAAEHGQGGLQGLLLAPIPRRDLFLARTLAGLPLLLGLTLATWGLTVALFPDLVHLASLAPWPGLLMGTLGLSVLGALSSWAALSTRTGELIGLGLALPLAAPLLVAVLHATQQAATTGQAWGPSLTFALGYDLAVGALAYLVADHVTEVSP